MVEIFTTTGRRLFANVTKSGVLLEAETAVLPAIPGGLSALLLEQLKPVNVANSSVMKRIMILGIVFSSKTKVLLPIF
jgi:hypothetical protein